MTVILLSPVEGLQPEEEYTGPNEDWLLQEGYAKPKTKRREEPKFLTKPRDLEYEHDDESLYPDLHEDSVAGVPSQRVLPVDPATAVQTGHPADPLTDTDEDLRPTQEDAVPKEVTDSTHVVGPLEGVQTPSDDTLAAADALVEHPDEEGTGPTPEEDSGDAPAVPEDEVANKPTVSVNENPINYGDPEPVEQDVDPAEVEPNETAADADGISSEEERTLEPEDQPEAPTVEDVDLDLDEEPAEGGAEADR